MSKRKRSDERNGTHIGANILAHRRRRGLSQTQLGRMVGVTYQQIQKYERSTNGISASRLYRLSRALDVPIEVLFGALEIGENKPEISDDETKLVREFCQISDARLRRAFVLFVQAAFVAGEGAARVAVSDMELKT